MVAALSWLTSAAEQEWVKQFGFTVENQELVDGFELRDSMSSRFSATYARFYEAHIRAERYRLVSEWLVSWLLRFSLYSRSPGTRLGNCWLLHRRCGGRTASSGR